MEAPYYIPRYSRRLQSHGGRITALWVFWRCGHFWDWLTLSCRASGMQSSRPLPREASLDESEVSPLGALCCCLLGAWRGWLTQWKGVTAQEPMTTAFRRRRRQRHRHDEHVAVSSDTHLMTGPEARGSNNPDQAASNICDCPTSGDNNHHGDHRHSLGVETTPGHCHTTARGSTTSMSNTIPTYIRTNGEHLNPNTSSPAGREEASLLNIQTMGDLLIKTSTAQADIPLASTKRDHLATPALSTTPASGQRQNPLQHCRIAQKVEPGKPLLAPGLLLPLPERSSGFSTGSSSSSHPCHGKESRLGALDPVADHGQQQEHNHCSRNYTKLQSGIHTRQLQDTDHNQCVRMASQGSRHDSRGSRCDSQEPAGDR